MLTFGAYRKLVCASTLLTVLGYILQFVGLRAVEWPILVSHLCLALVQVVLRAVARRGLALDPPAVELQDTQELASFCLAVAKPTAGADGRSASFVSYIGKLRTWSPKVDSRWELATGELSGLECTPPSHQGRSVITSFPTIEMLAPKSRTRSLIKRRPGGAQHGQEPRLARELTEVKLFMQIAHQHPHLVPPEVTVLGERLENAVKGVIDWLRSPGSDGMGWKDGAIFDLLDPSAAANVPVTWEVSFMRRYGRSSSFCAPQELSLVGFPVGSVDFSSLNATLCFWLHTLAARYGSIGGRFNQEGFYGEQKFCRVMGMKRSHNRCGQMLQDWTGRRMYVKEVKPAQNKLETGAVRRRDLPLSRSISFGMHLAHSIR